MSNKFYTDEEAQELQKLDVFTYLYNYEPSELVKSGKKNTERQRIPLWLSLMESGYGFLKERWGKCNQLFNGC